MPIYFLINEHFHVPYIFLSRPYIFFMKSMSIVQIHHTIRTLNTCRLSETSRIVLNAEKIYEFGKTDPMSSILHFPSRRPCAIDFLQASSTEETGMISVKREKQRLHNILEH